MSDVTDDVLAAWRAGETAAVATVVRASASTPCPPGTAMALLPDGSVVGSVSGGCVEADVLAALHDVREGVPSAVHRYGMADDVIAVGLPCGGNIDVHVAAVSPDSAPHLDVVAQDRAADRPVAIATVVADRDRSRLDASLVVRSDEVLGTTGSPRLDRAVEGAARTMLASGRSADVDLAPDGGPGEGVSVFVASHPARPRMLVYGAAAVAEAVTRQGVLLGYRVTVCDHRSEFATPRRFPAADEVVVARPAEHLAGELETGALDGRTVVCALTHDARIDVDLLEVALRADLGYVGAIGSRRVHEDRVRRLRTRGVTPDQLAALCSPIGLDLGAETPAEIALAVAAEVTARRHGASGMPLSDLRASVHRREPPGRSA